MSDARKLTLDEIKKLPKASVIWREEFTGDDETGFIYYLLDPMLVCIPGDGGVLAWADESSCLILPIDEDLLANRSFWNMEPDPDMIKGVPVAEFNKFIRNNPLVNFCFPQSSLLSEITRSGFTVSRFCHEMNIEESELVKRLQSENIEKDFLRKCRKIINSTKKPKRSAQRK